MTSDSYKLISVFQTMSNFEMLIRFPQFCLKKNVEFFRQYKF